MPDFLNSCLSVIQSILDVWGHIWPILVAILAFLALIMIHEFGHFIFAKMLGVKVNEYSIGFGPTLFKWQGKETKYSIRAVPFGGFCAMEGEDEASENPRGFCNKKPWRRFLIIVAGAAFNIILGFIILIFAALPNNLLPTTQIARFENNDKFTSVSNAEGGLKEKDIIYSVNGRRIFSTVDLSYAFSGVEKGLVDITVIRDNEKVDLGEVKFNTTTREGIEYVVVDFYVYGQEKTFVNVIKHAANQTVSYSRIVWFSLVDLISGKYGISQMSGPVGVTAVVSDAVKSGVGNLLPILAFITINLGIFNLLPIPSLDGSRALFILIEIIFRKPVPRKFESIIHTVGLVIMLLFILLITVKDIFSFF